MIDVLRQAVSTIALIGAVCASVAAIPARAGKDRTASTPYSLPRSTVAEVRNNAGESYRIMVAWPAGEPPAAGWPVLYVLDGEDNFAIAALTARRLARAGDRGGVASGIVVGIEAGPLARRVRDYTPPTPGWTIPTGQPASGLATGGAAAFLDLLERQVRPFVHKGRGTIDATRETLLGHSFGGVLALHAAFTRPGLFDGVVAVSPSLWFGDGLMTREAAMAGVPSRILIAEGDEAGSNRQPGGSSEQLVRLLHGGRAAGTATFLPLPEQSHGTTMLAAMVPAIRFAFREDGR